MREDIPLNGRRLATRAVAAVRQRAITHYMSRLPADGVVLMLHRVRESDGATFDPQRPISVSPDGLSKLLEQMRRRGLQIITIDEMCDVICRGGRIRKSVVITLDDGFYDNCETACDIFDAYRVPFTLFVVSGYVRRTVTPARFFVERVVSTHDRVVVDGKRFDCHTVPLKYDVYRSILRELRRRDSAADFAAEHGVDIRLLMDELFMNAAQLRDVSSMRLCSIGSHAISHPLLRQLPSLAVIQEMIDSKRDIERVVEADVRFFAYPFGSCFAAGTREYESAKRCGYMAAFTTVPAGINSRSQRNVFALPRVNVTYDDSLDSEAFVCRLAAMMSC